MRQYWWVSLIVVLGACQVFQGSDTQATLEAGVNGYATESAVIQQSMAQQRAQAQATANAVATAVAQMNQANQQLLATAYQFVTPTQAVVPGVAESAVGMAEGSSAPRQFTETGTATQVRQSDGCPESLQSRFAPNTPRIYVTARVTNLMTDALMTVEWLYENQVVFSDSWNVSPGGSAFCVWYFITPQDVTFSPGSWTVRLSADGTAVGAPVPFTIDAGDS